MHPHTHAGQAPHPPSPQLVDMANNHRTTQNCRHPGQCNTASTNTSITFHLTIPLTPHHTCVDILQPDECYGLLVVVAPRPLRLVLQQALVLDQTKGGSKTCANIMQSHNTAVWYSQAQHLKHTYCYKRRSHRHAVGAATDRTGEHCRATVTPVTTHHSGSAGLSVCRNARYTQHPNHINPIQCINAAYHS